MKKNEKIKLLHERFLHLAQDILWDAIAAKEVAQSAIEFVKENYQTDFLISEVQKIIDHEIELFFQDMLTEIREDSEIAEKRLMKILSNKFLSTVQYRISKDAFVMNNDDAGNIIQNTLMVIHKKCLTAKPKSTFFLWAMKILSNKYMEYRRKVKRRRLREVSLSEEITEILHETKMSDIISTRKKEKQVKTEEVEKLVSDNIDIDPFESDPYDWSPTLLAESKNLKNCLLNIAIKMEEKCKKVFETLFSKGDVRIVHKQFPGLARERIDVIISKCRKKLKNEAIAKGIL